MEPNGNSEEITSIEIDKHLEYLHDSERDDKATWKLLQQAQQREDCNFKDECKHKYKLPETKVFHSFASNIYNNYQNLGAKNIAYESDWKLLYRVKGKVFFKKFDGFFAELYFNTENHFLLLVIKGSSSIGNFWSDIKNVGFGSKGGELNSAFTFGEKVRVLMNKFKCKPMLLITGHSLGGYLAQITTYTITYCFVDENGKVMSRKEPMDDFGIYTLVFDSPAALKQISSIDPRDPVKSERFRLPIVNFIVDVNIINSNSKVGQHLGQVISVKIFQALEMPNKRKRISNAISVHGIKNFEDINLSECQQVEYVPHKKIVKYKKQEIQSCFFSAKNFERLHKYLILAAMCAELVEWLPSFKISNFHINLNDEKVSPQDFIPRVHRFLAKFKDDLDNGVFDGKYIIDNALYNLWRAEMLKDAHEFFLNEKWIERVKNWKDGTTIHGFESYEEMRFVGCMLHNSIPSYFHYDYEQYISLGKKGVENFKATNTVTLILMVKEKNEKISHEARGRVKIVYLVLDSIANEKVNMNLATLDPQSQEQLKNTQIKFMGNEVSVLDIFGSDLVEKLTIWNIYNFKKDEAVAKPNHFYSNQTISGKSKEFKSAIEFARELIKKELQFVLISSDAGMGKSTALWQIALTLQQKLKDNWIVHINLFDIQTELASAKDKLTSKEEAVEFVRNLELAERKSNEVLVKVFNCKLQEKKMMFLFDSLDEVCLFHGEAVEIFIALLSETRLQIVLTTRPHEGENFKTAEHFKLEPLDRRQIKNFVDTKFKMLGKEPPSDIEEWLRKINFNSFSDNGFWSLPLNLNMATSVYEADADIAEPEEERSNENIFELFLTKSIENTLKIKFNLEKNEHQAASMPTYKNKVDKFNDLFEILAVCLIFHGGEIINLEREVLREKIVKNGEEINRFDVAKLDNKYKFVSFLHRSYAEYLVAKVFIKCHQKDFNCQAMKLNNKQLDSIYLEKDFREIRKHVCQILAASPSVKMDFFPDFKIWIKKNLLEVMIEEDCYELYLQTKNQIKFPFKKSFFGFTNFNDFKPLYIALQKARKEFVQQLLKDGAKFEDILNEKYVLHLAIQKGFNQEVKQHFERLKSSLNKEINNYFPLGYAAECANIDMVKFLIEKGADVNAKGIFDITALYYAIKANNTEVWELLIAKGADCTDALEWAAVFSRKVLLNVIYKNTPSECREERVREAHFITASKGNLDIFKHICGFPEADPQALDSRGDTFLHRAAEKGHLLCMPFILEFMNQPVDVRNENGETALMRAFNYNKAKVVEWLLEQHADIHAVDDKGKSCLHYAAIRGSVNLVQICLAAGIDLNRQDNYGKTALYYASENSCNVFVKYLLKKGANPDITDNEGNTCLHTACNNSKFDSSLYSFGFTSDYMCIVKLLVDLVPLNFTNDKGETPLHVAALKGNEEIVEFLLEEAKKRNLEPVDGEKIIRLTKILNEHERWAKSSDEKPKAVRNEIMKWQFIVKKCSSS